MHLINYQFQTHPFININRIISRHSDRQADWSIICRRYNFWQVVRKFHSSFDFVKEFNIVFCQIYIEDVYSNICQGMYIISIIILIIQNKKQYQSIVKTSENQILIHKIERCGVRTQTQTWITRWMDKFKHGREPIQFNSTISF